MQLFTNLVEGMLIHDVGEIWRPYSGLDGLHLFLLFSSGLVYKY